ncbi:unnamed protein product [Mytilus coruscus]|uniref:Uncharacterized protein n=1 Tax=Mytilus coruscus TaxID=42192 RepID=A0A6J8BJE0_MYTCO|nr:unnamed protein product [Mytilus coruscus]
MPEQTCIDSMNIDSTPYYLTAIFPIVTSCPFRSSYTEIELCTRNSTTMERMTASHVTLVHSDPTRHVAPRGNQNIDVIATPSTQGSFNISKDEYIASNQNQTNHVELDPVTETIPEKAPLRDLMSRIYFQRTSVYRSRAVDSNKRKVTQDKIVPQNQQKNGVKDFIRSHSFRIDGASELSRMGVSDT